jgi:hypothetical protein
MELELLHQPLHAVGEVLNGMPLGNAQMSLPNQRFKGNIQVAHTITLVFVGVAFSFLGIFRVSFALKIAGFNPS